jgi:hypothetical protein
MCCVIFDFAREEHYGILCKNQEVRVENFPSLPLKLRLGAIFFYIDKISKPFYVSEHSFMYLTVSS